MAALFGGDACGKMRSRRSLKEKKRTGVRRYVCFGGTFGKLGGKPRKVTGIDGSTLSSSDGRRSGDGERDRGGTKVGVAGIAIQMVQHW